MTHHAGRLRSVVVALAGIGAVLSGLYGYWTVYRGVNASAPTVAEPKNTLIAEKSIAVLPFVDISENHDQEYFSDGLTEELIDHLTRAVGLKVIARTSSFQFKGKNEDMRAIGKKLGVATLLEGSVRKSGNMIRVTAQLIRAEDGTHLWSHSYDRTMSDIFQLQDEIAEIISQAMSVTLKLTSTAPLAPNADAHNLFLQANYLGQRYTAPDLLRAVELYQQAIQLDPNYALAWAKLANAYFRLAVMGQQPEQTMEQSRQALARSLELNPKLPMAHRMLVFRDILDWNWDGAAQEVDLLRGLLPPESPDLLAAWQARSIAMGRIDEAIPLMRKMVENDPLNPVVVANLAIGLLNAGPLEEAVALFPRIFDDSPNFAGAHGALSLALLKLGRNTEALAAMEQESDVKTRRYGLPMVYWALGRRDQAIALMNAAEQKFADQDAYAIACVYAMRGDKDTAFTWLERAFRQHDTDMSWIKQESMLADLRGDERFQALLAKMKLPS